jgi:type IV pilus assembly protein PilM
MVESLPAFVRNDDVEQLLDGILEADSLSTALRLSPLVDDGLVALAKRLVKIAPKDESAAKQLAELQARRAAKPANAHVPFPAWSSPPRRTLLGVPVDRLGHFTRCDFASAELEAKVREQPGQFFVALGAALQAKELAAVKLNLLPEKQSTLMDRFSISLSFRKPKPKGGWGLDLGRTGLRAIRLGPETNNGRVRIENVVHIPHSKPLGQTGDEVFDVDLIAATLRAFHEQFPPPKDKDQREPAVASLPGGRTLGRFFDLPPVDSKKLPELVQYEAKHQVPFSLDELMWDYQILEEAATKPDESPRHMMLLAAKDFHVNERLTALKNAEIEIDALTADPVALHNAVVYEFLSGEAQRRYLAFMDIGTQGASFVVSSQKSVWFRTSSNGADEFTAALVKQLQLTSSAAEEIKRAPHKARRFHEWQAALQPLLVKQASEIERSLASFARQAPDANVEQLYLAGGGAATHGLLRYLIHGR